MPVAAAAPRHPGGRRCGWPRCWRSKVAGAAPCPMLHRAAAAAHLLLLLLGERCIAVRLRWSSLHAGGLPLPC
jgi:hypothetical protein